MSSPSDRARRTRAAVHRRRFGWPGTEPAEVRPRIGQFTIPWLAAIAALVATRSLIGGVVILAVSLGLGVPKSWSWENDRLGAWLWAVAVALAVAAVVAYAGGGTAGHRAIVKAMTTSGALLLIGAIVAFGDSLYRWGTLGNMYYTDYRLRKGDPVAAEATREAAEKEGWKPRPRSRG